MDASSSLLLPSSQTHLQALIDSCALHFLHSTDPLAAWFIVGSSGLPLVPSIVFPHHLDEFLAQTSRLSLRSSWDCRYTPPRELIFYIFVGRGLSLCCPGCFSLLFVEAPLTIVRVLRIRSLSPFLSRKHKTSPSLVPHIMLPLRSGDIVELPSSGIDEL